MDEKNSIEVDLEKCLSSGKYIRLFLDDLIELVINHQISPEVIFREIRAMEGKGSPLLNNSDVESFMVTWNDDPKKMFQSIRPSASATKESSEFSRPTLKGLHHKHYYVNQESFIETNVNNQLKRYPGATPLGAMITRIAEGRLTGEWIVFKKTDGVNTYLCLGKHGNDEAIYDRLIANSVDHY